MKFTLPCLAVVLLGACTTGDLNLNKDAACLTDETVPEAARGKSGGAGVVSQEWDANILVVKTYVYAVCEGTTLAGKYKVFGGNLEIAYNETITGDPTKCRCPRVYTHKFTGLMKRTYTIDIKFQ